MLYSANTICYQRSIWCRVGTYDILMVVRVYTNYLKFGMMKNRALKTRIRTQNKKHTNKKKVEKSAFELNKENNINYFKLNYIRF